MARLFFSSQIGMTIQAWSQ